MQKKLSKIAVFVITALSLSQPSLAQLDSSHSLMVQEDYFELISEYVNKVENIYEGSWAFTYRIDDKLEQETRTIRRNMSLPYLESETLLSVSGMPPTQEDLEKHAEELKESYERRQKREERERKERLKRAENDSKQQAALPGEEEEGSEKERFLEMIVKDSIYEIEHESELLVLGFKATEEGREEIYENLDAVLLLDTEAGYIKELQVKVNQAFSPFFLSKIEEGYFSVRFDFNNGSPMQSEVSWMLKGHAFFVRSLDAEQEVRWFDFEKNEQTN